MTAGEWEPTLSLAQQRTGLPGALDWSSVGVDQWVRIVPTRIELARARFDWDDDGQGGRCIERLSVDRKLLPAAPVLDPGGSPELLVCERFVETLDSLDVAGWYAQPVDHLTPHVIHARPTFRLAIGGHPFSVVTGLDTRNNPVGPIVLNASSVTNADIGWTPWLGGGRSWRALIARGALVRSFHQRHPDAEPLQLLPVGMRGIPRRGGEPGRWVREQLPDHVPTLDASWSRLVGPRHTIAAPAPESVVLRTCAALGLDPRSALGQFLRRCDGALLFGGALSLFAVSSPTPRVAAGFESRSIVEENSSGLLASSGLVLPPGVRLFARSHEGGVFWGVEGNRVFGYGRGAPPHGGQVYGPGQTLEEWFGDITADLEYLSSDVH